MYRVAATGTRKADIRVAVAYETLFVTVADEPANGGSLVKLAFFIRFLRRVCADDARAR